MTHDENNILPVQCSASIHFASYANTRLLQPTVPTLSYSRFHKTCSVSTQFIIVGFTVRIRVSSLLSNPRTARLLRLYLCALASTRATQPLSLNLSHPHPVGSRTVAFRGAGTGCVLCETAPAGSPFHPCTSNSSGSVTSAYAPPVSGFASRWRPRIM